MKHAVFILLFLCCTRLFSQIGAPDLRCLSVGPGGSVTLTWIPPADPSHLFDHYEIYCSLVNSNGPYLLLGTAGSIATYSYVHSTTLTTVQSLYYYVAAFTGGGAVVRSDTLHTIRLDILSPPGAVDLKIEYNNIHEPALNSSSSTYTVNKEYPVGSWNPLGVTEAIKYADTISVCNAHISYQILLRDNSGCVSTSNVISGMYTDLYRPGGPTGPAIDSISVMPDGSTTIVWRVPRDMDIIKYMIYYRGGANAIISPTDTVYGRLTTSYTYTTQDANSHPLSLFVAAVDSCSQAPGLYNISPITMYLNASYDNCSYATSLHWNPYQGLRDGILEYRVYYSANGSAFTQVGSTQDTAFVHNGTTPGQNACYYVRVFNNTKTITASSNRSCFYATQVPSPGFVYIKTATVAGPSSVQINLLVDTARTCRGFDLFRSADGQNFSNAGFLPFAKQQPQLSFTDATNLQTGKQSYVYKAIVQDDCGNLRTVSNVCRTILLKVADDQENIFTKHLSWNAYEGFSGGISGYTIYRVINNAAPGSAIGTTGPNATTYTDDVENAAGEGANVAYLVQAQEGGGNIYGFAETSNSNPANVYMEGTIYIPNAFAPNGHNTTWRPVTHFIDKTDYSVNVFDRWGHQVFSTNSDTIAWDGSDCMPGVYAYLIRYKTATGEYKEIKGTVLMLE